jgi:Flp pilus assembly pilin Flp
MGFHMIKHSMVEMRRRWQHGSGAAALEYGLIAAGSALLLAAVVSPIGQRLATGFTEIGTAMGVKAG